MNRFVKILGAAAGSAAIIATGIGVSSSVAQTNYPPCAAGQQPTPQAPCIPAGMTPPSGGGMPSMPSMPGANGGNGGAGGAPNPTLANMPKCGTNGTGPVPTPGAPCMIDPQMPDCAPGQQPPSIGPDGTIQGTPCKPSGAVQFNQAPPKEAMNKLMTLDVDVDGSGEAPNSFDVSLNKIVKGIGKAARADLQDKLEGESFTLGTTKATKCFADKKSDADALADPVSCATLSDAADNYAQTVQAIVQARMKFDTTTMMPTFTATKIVIKGKSKI